MRLMRYLGKSAGLSLVELLVSLALLTIILLPIGSGLVVGLRIMEEQLDTLEASQDARMTLGMLADRIRRAAKVGIVANPAEAGGFMLQLTDVDGTTESYYKLNNGHDLLVVRNIGAPLQIISDMQPADVFTFEFRTDEIKPSIPLAERQLQVNEYVALTLSVTSREGRRYVARTIVRPRNP